MKIAQYVHRCTVQSGPLEGNDHTEVPSTWDPTAVCPNCKEVIVTPEQLIWHVYNELAVSDG